MAGEANEHHKACGRKVLQNKCQKQVTSAGMEHRCTEHRIPVACLKRRSAREDLPCPRLISRALHEFAAEQPHKCRGPALARRDVANPGGCQEGLTGLRLGEEFAQEKEVKSILFPPGLLHPEEKLRRGKGDRHIIDVDDDGL